MVTGAIKAKKMMRLFDHQLFKGSTAPSALFWPMECRWINSAMQVVSAWVYYYPVVRTGSSNTRCLYPAVRMGSSNTRFFILPSGWGLVIPVFLPRRQDGV